MLALPKRWLIETEDWLRYHPRVRNLIGVYKAWRGTRTQPAAHQDTARAIKELCAVARLRSDPASVREVEKRIGDLVKGLDPSQVDWTEFSKDVERPATGRGVILKPWLGPRERGIIYVGFEMEWLKLLRHVPLAAFAERYTLVIAPSSHPYNLINYVFPAAYPAPLYTLINHDEDVEILRRISPKYRVVPMYTSHWVNPAIYRPRPRAERDIDILMVAAWGKVKRHHLLFRALQQLPRSVRVLLIGQDQDGRTEATMRREAAYYGVADRFELRSNASHAEVRDAFCRSRLSLLLSLREGSAVVVPESLFADTPVGLLHNADNGSRAFINPATGRFLTEKNFAAELADFLAHTDSFSARAWAEANISCVQSTARLNSILKQDALAEGQEWTRDILPLCWQPDPRLVKPEDWRALQGERAEIQSRHGIALGLPELKD